MKHSDAISFEETMCEVSGNEFWKLCLFKVAIRKCSSRQDVQRSSWKSLGGHTLKYLKGVPVVSLKMFLERDHLCHCCIKSATSL